jgi:Flp pilus assembly protein TadD
MWMDVLQKTRFHRAGETLAKSLNNTAVELIKGGELQPGIALLQQATLLCPPVPEIEANLARALLQTGDCEGARQHAETAVRLEAEEAAYHHLRGQLARSKGDLTAAEVGFRTAQRLAPGDVVIHTDLAQCLADQKRFDEAIDTFKAVLVAHPEAADARHRLATTLAAANHVEEAITQAEALARHAPRDPRPHVLLGLIDTQRGHDQAALQHLREALRLEPRAAAMHCLMGTVQRKLGDLDGAVRSYRQALALDPHLVDAQKGFREISANHQSGPRLCP